MELQELFSAICNMTITASVVIGCVMLARLALRKAPRVFSYALWAVVLFRLLCPVSVSAPVSVLSVVDAPEPRESVGTVEYVESPVQAPVETIYVGEVHIQEGAPSVSSVAEPPIDWHLIAACGWAMGAAALAVYGILSYVNLKRKLREATPIAKGIREADGIRTPFVLGILRPVIYLPSDLGQEERGYILLHEQYHIRHGDHVVKALFWLAVCLHWFNPLVWLAFVLCTRDMEMRCDEAVLKQLGPQVRSDYAQSLLNLASGRRMVLAPLAFGEGDTGKRVKHVLGWKRKALWVAVPAAVLCVVVLIVTAVNPGGSLFGETPFGHSYWGEWVVSVPDVSVSADTLYTLTSDQVLFVRDGSETHQRGTFIKANVPLEHPSITPPDLKFSQTRRAWRTEGSDWWLLEQEDGVLWLIDENEGTMSRLTRADLLGVSVNQPGRESHVEPVWYQANSPDWYSGSLSATLVDGDAEVYFIPETEVDTITVSEEYYQRLEADATDIHKNVYTLSPDENGDFVLNVSRRGSEGDDYAIYRVKVGEEQYMFRLSFPAVPGVTSYEAEVEEETREVTFSEQGGYITLQIPESWEYSVTSFAQNENAAGIVFWPRGREEGKLLFQFYCSGFGVCGTGLESSTMTLAGREVSVGTYDGASLWDFISFGDDFAVWGEGHGSWWTEYGETAMEILDSAVFGREADYVDMDAVRSYFRNYRLYEDLGPGEVLLGEKDYQAVYYGREETVLLYEYAASGTQVEVLNAWGGRVYEDVCVSINCLEREGEYVYFGYLRPSQDGTRLMDGSFRLLLESSWTIDMILDDFQGFCFVCDAPMEDFEVRTADGTLVLNLAGYLERGCQVAEAEGKIVLNVEGEPVCELTPGPTEP